MNEIIYVLTNSAMASFVKVGRAKDLKEVIKKLDTPSVPFPFRCYYAAEVDNASQVEKMLHKFFLNEMVNNKKGFLQVPPEQVKKVLEFAAVTDVTPENHVTLEEVLAGAITDVTPKKGYLANPTNVDTVNRGSAIFLVREKMVEAINQKNGITLRRRTQAEYEDFQTGTGVRLMVSRKYNISNNDHYWYTPHTNQIQFLKNVKRGYICFGFTDKKIACLVPIADISSLLGNCGTTERGDDIGYHFFIKEKDNGNLVFHFSKTRKEYDLSKYIINLD